MSYTLLKDMDEMLVETDKYIQDLLVLIHQPNPIVDIFMYTIGILSMLTILYLIFSAKHVYNI